MSTPTSDDARPHRVAVLEPDLRVRNALFSLLHAARYDVRDWSPADPATGASWHDVAIVDPTAHAAAPMLTVLGSAPSPVVILLAQHPELVPPVIAQRSAALLSKTCDPQDLLNALQAALLSSPAGLLRRDQMPYDVEADRKVQPS